MEDNDFLLSLQRGDPDAFARLVNQHQHRVRNICYRFLCNKEVAQDVTQEVFFEVYKSIGKFRQEAKLSTWIYRIAVTRSLNFHQKRKRKERIEQVRNALRFKAEKFQALIRDVFHPQAPPGQEQPSERPRPPRPDETPDRKRSPERREPPRPEETRSAPRPEG